MSISAALASGACNDVAAPLFSVRRLRWIEKTQHAMFTRARTTQTMLGARPVAASSDVTKQHEKESNKKEKSESTSKDRSIKATSYSLSTILILAAFTVIILTQNSFCQQLQHFFYMGTCRGEDPGSSAESEVATGVSLDSVITLQVV